jgi:malonate-semialdehyde dehydrogenase (acetylating) / methylmalonate-semialdehyde dehydrogenase
MALSTVLFVGESQKWIPELVEKVKTLRVGPGWVEGSDVGPLITKEHRLHVLRMIESAKKQGASVVLDGSEFKHAEYP